MFIGNVGIGWKLVHWPVAYNTTTRWKYYLSLFILASVPQPHGPIFFLPFITSSSKVEFRRINLHKERELEGLHPGFTLRSFEATYTGSSHSTDLRQTRRGAWRSRSSNIYLSPCGPPPARVSLIEGVQTLTLDLERNPTRAK